MSRPGEFTGQFNYSQIPAVDFTSISSPVHANGRDDTAVRHGSL
jgi:hypothetical protein